MQEARKEKRVPWSVLGLLVLLVILCEVTSGWRRFLLPLLVTYTVAFASAKAWNQDA